MPPACGRRRPGYPGAWVPSGLDAPGAGRSQPRLVQSGPSNLDVECKACLQKLLKPVHYGAIDIWLRTNTREKEKRGLLKLREAAVGNNGVPVQQDGKTITHAASIELVQSNQNGRHRLATAVHQTGDRHQADLLRNRSGEDQRNKERVRQRKFLDGYASIPSLDSHADYYRLSDTPVAAEPSAKVLSEEARRGLSRWQIRAPEQNREDTASVMLALRSIAEAVKALPTYTDQLRARSQSSFGDAPHESLLEYGHIKAASRNGTYMRELPKNKTMTRSCPTLQPPLAPDEMIQNIKRPGGYVVGLMDWEPVAMLKNKQRNITSKIVQGGATNWSTSYQLAMSSTPPPS